MNADLIARLRAYPTRDGVEAADALESLEQQVAAQQAQMYEDRRQALVWRDQVTALTKERDSAIDWMQARMNEQLDAAQADNARLRGVLKTIDETYEEGVKPGPLLATYCSTVAHAALALPTDDSALMERLKEERERCAEMAEGATAYTQFQTVEHYKIAAVIATAIRGLA